MKKSIQSNNLTKKNQKMQTSAPSSWQTSAIWTPLPLKTAEVLYGRPLGMNPSNAWKGKFEVASFFAI